MAGRIAVSVVLSVALVGCGGGSASSSSSTRNEFIARANAICRSAQKEAKPLVTAANRLDPTKLDAAVALLSRTAMELAAVKPPADMQAGYRGFLALAHNEIAVVTKLARYVRERNISAIRSLAGQLNSHTVNEQARRLGLTVCAEEVA